MTNSPPPDKLSTDPLITVLNKTTGELMPPDQWELIIHSPNQPTVKLNINASVINAYHFHVSESDNKKKMSQPPKL